MRAAVLLLLSTGCFQTTHRPTCEFDAEVVADDVEVAGVTAAELLAAVEGARVEAGTYVDGGSAEVTVEVTRAGDAEHVHATHTTSVSRGVGFGKNYPLIAVQCGDFVRVPVELQVTTDDGQVDLAVTSSLNGPMEDQGIVGLPESLSVHGDLPLDDATVPYGDEEDPDDWQDTYAFADVTFPTDGAATTGTVGWGGEQETDDAHISAQFDVLGW